MLAVDVKAIALLNTHSEAGFSLLLLIFGQFPAIQLSFGFTLTGVGGLIGVQHTASPTALSQALGAGQLDAVLFPENPVANAPQIINTLRTIVSGQERRLHHRADARARLGHAEPRHRAPRAADRSRTSSRSSARRSSQLPPLVSADLALLYLRLDFVGSVVFDPLRIAFDAKLIHSRVALSCRSPGSSRSARSSATSRRSSSAPAASIRASRRSRPTSRCRSTASARASTSASSASTFKGYFAITSATIQAGASLRVWADIGIAEHRGRLRLRRDLLPRAEVLLRGRHPRVSRRARIRHRLRVGPPRRHCSRDPGRWHIAGNAEGAHAVAAARFLAAHRRERGAPTATRRRSPSTSPSSSPRRSRSSRNWSAQLPQGGDGFVTLADIEAGTDVLAHPLGTLVFQQKLVPFELRMAKASGSKIERRERVLAAARCSCRRADSGRAERAAPRRAAISSPRRSSSRCRRTTARRSRRSSRTPPGYELGDDDFELGEIVPSDAGLRRGRPRRGAQARSLAPASRLERLRRASTARCWRFGAAGMSPLRDRALDAAGAADARSASTRRRWSSPTRTRCTPSPAAPACTPASGARIRRAPRYTHRRRRQSGVVELAEIA